MKLLLAVAVLIAAPALADTIPPTTNVEPPLSGDVFPVEVTSPQSRVVNHESRIATPLYVTEQPTMTEVVSKPFAIPHGWKMVEVAHPDKLVCTSYKQPSTWELVQIHVPKVKTPRVGIDNAASLTIIKGE